MPGPRSPIYAAKAVTHIQPPHPRQHSCTLAIRADFKYSKNNLFARFFAGTLSSQFTMTSNIQIFKRPHRPQQKCFIQNQIQRTRRQYTRYTTAQPSRVQRRESQRHTHKIHDDIRHEHSRLASVFSRRCSPSDHCFLHLMLRVP